MHPLILMLLLIVGACEAVFWQKLTCPYEKQHQSLLRVWCRQSSAGCCTGLTFSQSAHLLDGGKLKVTQGSDSFTVAMLEPSHGHGMYWCGVLSKNDTIIRLAEGYFHSSSGAFIWSVTRWILLPLLPMVTIFTNVYSRTTTNNMCKEAEYDDITMSRALTDPQCVNAAAFCELE
ncbi:CMRF35-like molecule 8 [Chaetodon trifascialis]|uniref:CMRF35-like molecule 8 n=1 Tax=Chaetodon trifascialis TaxID=109706 RepID=UPI0039922122